MEQGRTQKIWICEDNWQYQENVENIGIVS